MLFRSVAGVPALVALVGQESLALCLLPLEAEVDPPLDQRVLAEGAAGGLRLLSCCRGPRGILHRVRCGVLLLLALVAGGGPGLVRRRLLLRLLLLLLLSAGRPLVRQRGSLLAAGLLLRLLLLLLLGLRCRPLLPGRAPGRGAWAGPSLRIPRGGQGA